MKRYSPSEIEPRWQKFWDDQQTYKADLASDKTKYIAMSMFNYPSGAGLHIGHAMNYTISDIMARFKRQQGYESYHPVGWDSFGLPAENFAIKSGVSPQESMANIIPNYHKQYKAMGWSNDWSKEISTHEPGYYKWTQWIFAQMYKNGLAYQDARQQWWCDKCQTVLANEQVIDGKCWRHDSPDDPEVTKREVKQWFFKITDYADELLEATDALDWTEAVKTAQKNWIGKSVGAEIEFRAADVSDLDSPSISIRVFTTRPDTIFGATFMVLAPEHDLVSQIVTDDCRAEVAAYVKEVAKKTEVERQTAKEKTGVFTGAYAINPANGEKIPIWVADYVLSGYGTGAIMAVPAHDERDKEFAEKYNLPIIQVVAELLSGINDLEFRSNEKVVERNVAQCIVLHPTEDKIICLDVKGHNWRTLVMGGIEEGEDWVEAAKREIYEETGYKNAKFEKFVGPELWSEFWASHKQENRVAHFRGMVFRLKDLEQDEISQEESDKHFMSWVSVKEAIEKFSHAEPKIFVECAFGITEDVFTSEGKLINSNTYTGLNSAEARERIVADLSKKGVASEKTTFKIRDWSVSRQRYWGAPIPIINCDKCGQVLVPDDQLPVVLPELDDYAPSGDGRSALARAEDWLRVKCPECGGNAERETDTLDTYICSSWYMLRYFDPFNENKAFDSEVADKWMPIDFYNGGDHATAHMIYARFVTRFFHKLGLLENPEPFKKFLFNGKVTAHDGQMFSKSKGNGVDPLEIINQGYGADALRTYLMFASPLELWTRWDPQGVPGAYRFLNRVWNLVQEFAESDGAQTSDAPLKVIHPVIKKVTADLEDQKYNTAIASLMEATNDLYNLKAKDGIGGSSWKFTLESMVMLVGPFAPHIAEELWHQLGHDNSVHVDNWPVWDDKYLVSDTVKIAVQVNGKLRGEIEVVSDAGEEEIKTAALAHENVVKHLEDKKPAKVIYVPGRLVNIVI